MKGFFWIAACGLAAVAGVAVQNGGAISGAISEIAHHDSVVVDVNDDGDVTVARSSIGAVEADAAEAATEADAAIDEAVEALTLAQNRIAQIEANTDLSDEERAEALAAAQAERDEALALVRADQATPEDAGDQITAGIEQIVQGGITALEQSDARIERDGEVLTGEERAEAFDEMRREISDEFDN